MLHNNSIQYYYYIIHTILIKKHTQEITTSILRLINNYYLDIQILLFKINFFIYTHR